ncbi:MAG: 2-oxoglutarate dehydrogenase E1 subunit family protein, partial [Phycisphaeraceae bacterium]
MSQTPDLTPGNLVYVESQYERFLADPASVDDTWRQLFEAWSGEHNGNGMASRIGPSFTARSIFDPAGTLTHHPTTTNGQPIHVIAAPQVA